MYRRPGKSISSGSHGGRDGHGVHCAFYLRRGEVIYGKIRGVDGDRRSAHDDVDLGLSLPAVG